MQTRVNKSYTEVGQQAVSFGIKDKKGREVGYRWVTFQVVCTPAPDSQQSCWLLPDDVPMEHFEIRTTPTRDGKGYGPAFNYGRAATLAEAEALATKRMQNARKRDTKKFGGAA